MYIIVIKKKGKHEYVILNEKKKLVAFIKNKNKRNA